MTPTPIILDCDPGHDDAIALLLAIASPEVELIGVTTVAGNQTIDKTTNNALRILELAGRSDIPVYRGANRPVIRPRTSLRTCTARAGLTALTYRSRRGASRNCTQSSTSRRRSVRATAT